jgi:response regulator NasT
MLRVLVIAESSRQADEVCAGLRLAGHEPTSVVTPDDEFEAAIERHRPGLIVLEARSPSVDVLDRIMDATGSHPVPLIVFAQDSSAQAIERTVKAGASAYIVDGLKAERVPVVVQIALARFEFISQLRADLRAAEQKLAERKFVERAKGLLMKARNLSEDEAYHTLRRMAMERNRRLGDVARSVLEMADLLN